MKIEERVSIARQFRLSDKVQMTKKEVAAILGTTPRVAASILREHGAAPIDYGPGRGRGLRWTAHQVKDVLDALELANCPSSSTGKQCSSPPEFRPVFGRSGIEIYNEIHGIPPVQ